MINSVSQLTPLQNTELAKGCGDFTVGQSSRLSGWATSIDVLTPHHSSPRNRIWQVESLIRDLTCPRFGRSSIKWFVHTSVESMLTVCLQDTYEQNNKLLWLILLSSDSHYCFSPSSTLLKTTEQVSATGVIM